MSKLIVNFTIPCRVFVINDNQYSVLLSPCYKLTSASNNLPPSGHVWHVHRGGGCPGLSLVSPAQYWALIGWWRTWWHVTGLGEGRRSEHAPVDTLHFPTLLSSSGSVTRSTSTHSTQSSFIPGIDCFIRFVLRLVQLFCTFVSDLSEQLRPRPQWYPVICDEWEQGGGGMRGGWEYPESGLTRGQGDYHQPPGDQGRG